MKTIFLVIKKHFKKSVFLVLFMLMMMLALTSLTGCKFDFWNGSSTDNEETQETTKTKTSFVVSNTVETYDSVQEVNYPIKMKNENGVKTNIINSGKIVSMSYYSIYGKGAEEGKMMHDVFTDENIKGNVIIVPAFLIEDYDEEELFYNFGLVEIPNVNFDSSYLLSQDNPQHTIKSDMFEDYSVCGIKDFDIIDNPTEDFASDVTYYHLHNICESYDFIMTDYTWYEIDRTAPVINGTTHISINVDNQPSLEEILSYVYALDETDGYVPVVVDSSTYVPGVMELGDYEINISASDSEGNTNTSVITAHRYDCTGPVINGTDYYELNYFHRGEATG